MPNTRRHFFSCDWGTSSFRLKLVSLPDLAVLQSVESAHGIGTINKQLGPEFPAFERAMAFSGFLKDSLRMLLDQAEILPDSFPVMVSGMASSSVGWRDLPYAQTPFPLDGSGAVFKRLDLDFAPGPGMPVYLISGVATKTDMMRGEETQAIGLLGQPAFQTFSKEGVIVLPGTHSKHVVVQDGMITGVQTYMTGELFEVLASHSILRFTTQADGEGVDLSAFKLGVAAAMDEGLLKSLFHVRSRGVLAGESATSNRGYLSGLLIGAEIWDLKQQQPSAPILLAAAGPIAALYEAAAQVAALGDRFWIADPAQVESCVVPAHAILLPKCESRR